MRQVSIGQYLGLLIATIAWGILFYVGVWLAFDFTFRLAGLGGTALAAVALNHFAFGVGKAIQEG